jgi:phage pi2 protein 07
MSNIAQRLDALEQVILREIKTVLQETPIAISAQVSDFLYPPSYKQGLRVTESGNRYYTQKNPSDKLRVLYGNITRAVTVNGKGNYKKVEYKNGHFLIEFGYQPDTMVKAGNKTISLEYAAMHEAKERGKSTSIARPFLEPAFDQFFEKPEGWEYIRGKMEDVVVSEMRKVF